MNFFRFSLRRDNNSGIILIVVLWLTVILSVMAMGLSRQIGVEIQLTRYALAKVQSKAAAISGLAYAKAQMAWLSLADDVSEGETQYRLGFHLLEDQTPEDLFKDIEVGNNRFSIGYTRDDGSDNRELIFGFRAEESRLNLNAIGPQNYRILGDLLTLMGLDQDTADQIAVALVDWRDADNVVLIPTVGAEDDYYLSLENPYPCKNGSLESLEEFLAVRGVTPEIFEQISRFLTVMPTEGPLGINFSTASREVLLALARYYAGARTNTELSDAESLVDKILLHRCGDDGVEATADDRPVRLVGMPLNMKERVIALTMQKHQVPSSRYLRIKITGEEPRTGITAIIETVIDRESFSVLSWRRH